MRYFLANRRAIVATIISLVCTLSSCTTQRQTVERVGANVALRFTENNLVAPMLTSDDVSMACASGEAMTPMIMALGGGFGADDDQLVTLLYTMAALCVEGRTLEQELRYMRASRSNHVDEAMDARIIQKRLSALAGQRQYRAYQRIENYYEKNKITLGDKCPSFHRDFDELVFMVGLISGLQAIVNDISSQNMVGVPKDIAPRVDRAMACLNNDKWFGIPSATRALVWSMLPGAGGDQDPWQTLKKAMETGESKGVRLPHALYAMVAFIKEDDVHLREAFTRFAATQSNQKFKLNAQYRLLDKMGETVLMGLSDRYWTTHTGSRTPDDGLEKFWDAPLLQPRDVGVEIDDIL